MDIKSIINLDKKAEDIISALKVKSVVVKAWKVLELEYNPKKHPVMDTQKYPDRIEADGTTTAVTRVTYALQRLAVKRLTELCFGIPVRRVYDIPEGRDDLQEMADLMDAIFKANRIDAVNVRRGTSLFASCECMTLWYAEVKDTQYGKFKSKLKLRCVTYSPMLGDEIYPLFDEYGDLIALSVQYRRKTGTKETTYFDTYTADTHYKWSSVSEGGNGTTSTPGASAYQLEDKEDIKIGKIPAVYIWRPEPAWEDTSGIVYEMEWAMSRNGNYLRENSRPVFVVFADEQIPFGKEPAANAADKSVLKYPKGSNAAYVTWAQATDSLKFHVTELRQIFFTQLQLPDWSFDNMKAVPQSGESMKQMFIDAVLKVSDEEGRLVEAFDREINVVKAFMKKMAPGKESVIDELDVDVVITPCMLDENTEAKDEAAGEVVDGTRRQTDTNAGPGDLQKREQN